VYDESALQYSFTGMEGTMFQKACFTLLMTFLLPTLAACGTRSEPAPTPKPEVTPLKAAPLPDLPDTRIVRHPAPADFSFINPHPTSVPTYDSNSTNPFQIDFRSSDLVDLDLSRSMDILKLADFDSQTQWPPSNQLPASFSVQQTMDMGKDPGLGMRELHEKGITGRGVGIAIIDQTLLVDHQEYVKQLRVYEEGDDITDGWLGTSMHGPAVASIAVGKTVGVAPEADLYFIAKGNCGVDATASSSFDFSCLAKGVLRIIAINQGLPEHRKIRVLSLSIGWSAQQKGYPEMTDAVNKASAAGIFVISSSISQTYGFKFHGMGRDSQVDPNLFNSYLPGSWWAQQFYDGKTTLNQTLLVPMDARTTASPTGIHDYVFYGEGGWSWSIPYLAGMYALACQVDPGITPQRFWSTALQTGRTIRVEHNGKQYSFGVILDPQALIIALQK
jgi:subtilisin family serine protease